MTNNLRDLLNKNQNMHFATEHGNRTHIRLSGVQIDGKNTTGDDDLVAHICADKKLAFLFGPSSHPEVPIAGYVRNTFISRRIDRLLIDHTQKQIYILDYKTDIDPTSLYDKYTAQLRTYAELLHNIHPDYTTHKYILWTHNWKLEEIH